MPEAVQKQSRTALAMAALRGIASSTLAAQRRVAVPAHAAAGLGPCPSSSLPALLPQRLQNASQLRCLSQQQRTQRRLVVARSFEDATKSLKETAALDELIDMLLTAKTQQQVHCRNQSC